MSVKEFTPLSPICVRRLVDKTKQKRKGAALEIERIVEEKLSSNQSDDIIQILKLLGGDLVYSQNPNSRKGGLIGLAAVAIGLGKVSRQYTNELLLPALAAIHDSDCTVQFHSCEALFNIVKAVRSGALPFFNDIFNGISKLIAHPDDEMRNGAGVLDGLLKDIVTESSSFDLVAFLPLLREKLYVKNAMARQFILSWIETLDAVPNIQMVVFLPEILDGLFLILGEKNKDVRKLCQNVLAESLESVKRRNELFVFHQLSNILVLHSQNGGALLAQATALTWLREFTALSPGRLLPHMSGMLNAVLPCLSYGDQEHQKVRTAAEVLNINLHQLLESREDDDDDDQSSPQADSGKDSAFDEDTMADMLHTLSDEDATADTQRTASDEDTLQHTASDEDRSSDTQHSASDGDRSADTQHTASDGDRSADTQHTASDEDTTADTTASDKDTTQHTTSDEDRSADMQHIASDKDTTADTTASDKDRSANTQHTASDEDRLADTQHTASDKDTTADTTASDEDRSADTQHTASDKDTTADTTASSNSTQLQVFSIVQVLLPYLSHKNVQTRVAALKWIDHLLVKNPNKTSRCVPDFIQLLLDALSDEHESVVLLDLKILSEISSSPSGKKINLTLFKGKNGQTVPPGVHGILQSTRGLNPFFVHFMMELVALFRRNPQLFEDRGSFIVRRLCVSLGAEAVFSSLAEIVLQEETTFATGMTRSLNTILLTSPELFELRCELRALKTEESRSLFCRLYRCWCHSPVATLALTYLSQSYSHACQLLQHFGDVEITVDILKEIDKLIQLIESPVFSYLRLHLLDAERNRELIQSLYGLLMVLPQSEAFRMLKCRLECVPHFSYCNPSSHFRHRGEGSSDGCPQASDIPFQELLEHFVSVQTRHRQAKQRVLALRLSRQRSV